VAALAFVVTLGVGSTVLTTPAGAQGTPGLTGAATPTTTAAVTSTAPTSTTVPPDPPTAAPAGVAGPDDQIPPPTPEQQAAVEARARAYLAGQAAARAATHDGPAALPTADWAPWVGAQTLWCTYSNPGSPGNYCIGYHSYPALDISMPMGTPISAAGPGQVVDVQTGCVGGNTACGGQAGNFVSIVHPDGRYSRYMHLTSVSVAVGQNVVRGQSIGTSGWTGNVQPDQPSTAHLHYEEDLQRYGSPVDPGEMFRCQGGVAHAILAPGGWANWQKVPWGTVLQNDDFACAGGDRDADGVPDGVDNCPDVSGPIATGGCDLDATSSARTNADFNHDGLGDVAFVVAGPGGMGSQIQIAYGQAGGGVSAPATVWDSGAFGWNWDRVDVTAGDFTHDGFADLVLLYRQAGAGDGGSSSTLAFIAYGTASGLTAPTQLNAGALATLDAGRMKVTAGDYDGDGFADLGVLYADANNETEFFIGAGTAGGVGPATKVWDSGVGWWNGANSRVIGGDFDGDGRGDLGILQQFDPTHALLLTALGAAGPNGPTIGSLNLVWDSGAGGWNPLRTRISAGDYDGDGRDDIALLVGLDGARSQLFVAYGNGIGLTAPQPVWDSGPGGLDFQRTRLASCDTARTGRAQLGILFAGAGNATTLSLTGGDGSGGWVAPHVVWDSGATGSDGLHTQIVGCDFPLPVPSSKFHSFTPTRILDSRDGTGTTQAPWAAGETRPLIVTGAGGLPTTGISSVVLNVTVTAPQAAGFLTAWPNGLARPMVSNLNFTPGLTVANQVVVKVGAGGKVALFSNAGPVDVIADVVGYYDGGTGDSYNPLPPQRILDSRDGTGGIHQPWAEGASHDVQVTGVGGVPASGVSAVLLNVTAVDGTRPSHLSEWPTGQVKPTASILNFDTSDAVPNLVLAKVGAGGKISLFNNAGNVDIVADVVGWFGTATASNYTPLAGGRILDSRIGMGTPTGFGPQAVSDLQVTGVAGVPASGVTAVVLNVTVTNPTDASHLIVWPSGGPTPTASNLNFVAGQTVPNLVVVKVGAGGKVSLFNNQGSVDVLADVVGYYR
jgi:murein DD-endopeptidase MepM/ murein hydrolase activator NlpD